MGRQRLFLAVCLDEDTITTLGQATASLRSRIDGVKWVRPQGMHVTLHFFGSVPVETIVEIAPIVSSICARVSDFRLSVAGVGVFPSPRRASVIWAGVREGREEMASCATALRSELSSAGFETDGRPFSSHVTLGRVRRGARIPGQVIQDVLDSYAEHVFGQSMVTAVNLYSSNLQPGGAVYQVVKTWPFAGPSTVKRHART